MTKTKEELIEDIIKNLTDIENKQDDIDGADQFLSDQTLEMTDVLKIADLAKLALPNFPKDDLKKLLDETNELISEAE